MNVHQLAKSVVVGVDGSAEALRAVRWAIPEARRRQATLRLVAGFAWTADTMVAYGDHLRIAAQNDLGAAAAAVAELDPEVQVVSELVAGFPAKVLVEQSRNAALLVVGDRGRGRIRAALAGSVAAATAAGAVCPVVVVRGAEPIPDRPLPIVVGIDGTPLSEAAIAFAYDEASVRRVPLIAVHTWSGALTHPALALLVNWQEEAIAADELLAERLAGRGEKYPDVQVQRVVGRGRAAPVLLELAGRAQLVVVGSRGHREVAGFVLDSVGNAMVHTAGCPVAIVRTTSK